MTILCGFNTFHFTCSHLELIKSMTNTKLLISPAVMSEITDILLMRGSGTEWAETERRMKYCSFMTLTCKTEIIQRSLFFRQVFLRGDQCSLYLSWLTLPCSQSKEGHLPPCVENCKVIHASQKHLKKDKESMIQSVRGAAWLSCWGV